MKIGYFTSIEGWGGSEMYLLRLMQGVRERGHEVLLFGVAGTRLWEEAGRAGIARVVWRDIGGQRSEIGGRRSEVGLSGVALAKTGGQRSEDGGRRAVGGGERAVGSGLAFGVEDSGLQSSVFSLQSTSKSLQSRIKRLALSCVPSGIKLLAGNLREVLHLRRLFKAHPVDVMHVNVHGYEVAGIACRLARIPSVGVYCISLVKSQSIIQRSIEKWSGKAYKRIVGKSKFCLDGWMQLLGLPSGRGVVVYNGVDVATLPLPNRSHSHAGRKFRFVSTGRLHQMKGYDLLIKAFALARLEDCELVIAGEGEMRQALEALIAKHQLEDRVFLPGHVENIRKLLQDSDVFVLPSVSHESFGQSVIEAMALGLPVITSDFGPFPELNIHQETGLVVCAGSCLDIKAALDWCVTNPDEMWRMGGQGRKRVSTSFTHVAMVGQMMQLYEKTMNREVM